MKAAVLHTFGEPLQIEDVSIPDPATDEVQIQIEACGVCHSDLQIVRGDQPGFKSVTKGRLIPGHEVVGRVTNRGAGVDHLTIGQRVGVAWLHSSCGVCPQFAEGMENLCRKAVVTGLMVDGGYAEYLCAKASHVMAVPEVLVAVEAAPLFCAGVTVYRALANAPVRSGQRVAVIGVGGLGHLAVQIAIAMEAQVIALDVSPDKLALARELGAQQAFDVSDPKVFKEIQRLGGVHVAVVTSAASSAFDSAWKCVRPGGVISVVGLPTEPLKFLALALVTREIRIVGSAIGTRADLRAVLDLAAAGKLRCRVEAQPLAHINSVLEQMHKGAITGRVVLTPGASRL